MLTRGSGERVKKGDNGQISSQKKNNSCPLPHIKTILLVSAPNGGIFHLPVWVDSMGGGQGRNAKGH